MVETEKAHLRQKIALRDVAFYAYHGFYEEERVKGNEFLVDVKVWFTPRQPEQEGVDEDISRTVNYEVLYRIIREEMETTRHLLETVVDQMLKRCVSEFPFLDKAQVRIRKLNPPLGAEKATSSVQLTWRKNRK